jgi:hypothetical protein
VLSIVDDVPPQLFEIYASLDADEQGGMVGNTALFGPDFVFPFENALPDGEHFVRVDAFDQDGNGSSAIVHFSVGEAPATTGEPADSTGDDDDADDDDGTTAADDDDGGPRDAAASPSRCCAAPRGSAVRGSSACR